MKYIWTFIFFLFQSAGVVADVPDESFFLKVLTSSQEVCKNKKETILICELDFIKTWLETQGELGEKILQHSYLYCRAHKTPYSCEHHTIKQAFSPSSSKEEINITADEINSNCEDSIFCEVDLMRVTLQKRGYTWKVEFIQDSCSLSLREFSFMSNTIPLLDCEHRGLSLLLQETDPVIIEEHCKMVYVESMTECKKKFLSNTRDN